MSESASSFMSVPDLDSLLIELTSKLMGMMMSSETEEDEFKIKDLTSLIESYFKTTADTIAFLDTMETLFKDIQTSNLILQSAVKPYIETDKYAKTLEELYNFKVNFVDPFGEEYTTKLDHVQKRQILLKEKLRERSKELFHETSWKLQNQGTARSLATIGLTVGAAFIATPLVAGKIFVKQQVSKWKWLWNVNKMFRKQNGILCVLEDAAQVNKGVTKTIHSQVHNLKELSTSLKSFAVNGTRDDDDDDDDLSWWDQITIEVKMYRIKRKLEAFTEKIEEARKSTAESSTKIAQARLRVVELMKDVCKDL